MDRFINFVIRSLRHLFEPKLPDYGTLSESWFKEGLTGRRIE